MIESKNHDAKETNNEKNKYNKSSHKVIYNLQCAGFLMLHGCRLIRTEVNQENPRFNNFIFYDDEKTTYWLNEYSKQGDTPKNDKQKIHNRSNREQLHQMEQ